VGTDIPRGVPIQRFDDAAMPVVLQNNITKSKYTAPTPIQKYALPILMSGRDVMATAQTGSGKTAGFLLPIITNLLVDITRTQRPETGRGRYYCGFPLAVIMAPTRELASQIHQEALKFTESTRVKPVVIYGGAPYGDQARSIERGVDIIIATPGRLNDMMERKKISMSCCKYVILDEADRMLDMGFEPQIRQIIDQRDCPRKEHRQTIMFSATFPKLIQKLAMDFLKHDYIMIQVGRLGGSNADIKQVVKLVEYRDKNDTLLLDLKARAQYKQEKTLIFVETKKGVDDVCYFLRRNGFAAESIHGDHVQHQRESALRNFKSGRVPILIATSVAARGLDINDVAHVIEYDMPNNIDDHVHRIGRTGRAGKTGLATVYFSEKDKSVAKELMEQLQEAKQEVPAFLPRMVPQRGYGGRQGGRGGRGGYGGRGGGYGGRGGYGGGYGGSYGPPRTGGYGGGYGAPNGGGYASAPQSYGAAMPPNYGY